MGNGRNIPHVHDVQGSGWATGSRPSAFFINSRFLPGAPPFQAFAEIINEELMRADIKISSKLVEIATQP